MPSRARHAFIAIYPEAPRCGLNVLLTARAANQQVWGGGWAWCFAGGLSIAKAKTFRNRDSNPGLSGESRLS